MRVAGPHTQWLSANLLQLPNQTPGWSVSIGTACSSSFALPSSATMLLGPAATEPLSIFCPVCFVPAPWPSLMYPEPDCSNAAPPLLAALRGSSSVHGAPFHVPADAFANLLAPPLGCAAAASTAGLGVRSAVARFDCSGAKGAGAAAGEAAERGVTGRLPGRLGRGTLNPSCMLTSAGTALDGPCRMFWTCASAACMIAEQSCQTSISAHSMYTQQTWTRTVT